MTSSPASHCAVVLVGATVNLALLAAPLLFGAPHVGAPLVVFWCVATLFCVAEALAAGPTARMRAPPEHGSPLLTPLLGASLLTVFLLAVFEASRAAAPQPAAIAWLGAPMMLLGVTLRATAIRALGPRFASEVRLVPGHRLVQSGPYRLARHPSETGTLLLAFGAALLLTSPLAAALAACLLTPAVVHRTRLEDRMLQEAFGPTFEAYARRVPSLVPRLLG